MTLYGGSSVRKIEKELEKKITYKGFYIGSRNEPDLLSSEVEITGTVTISRSPTVTGSGTAFQTELEVGDRIKIETTSYSIGDILSDNQLTVNGTFFFQAASNVICNKIVPPETEIKESDLYFNSSNNASFYSKKLYRNDVLIAKKDNPTTENDWLYVNADIDDSKIGVKAPSNSTFYVNFSDGSDDNLGVSSSQPLATINGLIEVLKKYDFSRRDPLRIFFRGDTISNISLRGIGIINPPGLEININFSNPFTGNLLVYDFPFSTVSVEGTFTGQGKITVSDCDGFFAVTDLQGDSISGNEPFISLLRLNSVFARVSLNSISCPNAYLLEGVRRATIDSVLSGTIDVESYVKLKDCQEIESTLGTPFTLNSGRVFDASESKDIRIKESNAKLDAPLPNLYPLSYRLNDVWYSRFAGFYGHTHVRNGLLSEAGAIASQWVLKVGNGYIYNTSDRNSEPIEFKVEEDLTLDFPPPLLSNNKVWTYIDAVLTLSYTIEAPKSWELKDRLYLNTIESSDGINISAVTPIVLEGDTYTKQLLDKGGTSNVDLSLTPATALSLATNGGSVLIAGVNHFDNLGNSHAVEATASNQIIWDEYDPTGVLIATGITDLDFGRYWDGSAVDTFTGNDATVKFFYIDSNSNYSCVIGSQRYSNINVCSERWRTFETIPRFNDRALVSVLLGREDAVATNSDRVIILDRRYD